MPRKSLILATMLVAILIFIVPLLAYTGAPFCAITTANAQDSPCAAQEATISALEAENISLRATIEALTVNLRILLTVDASPDTYIDNDVTETANAIERRLNELGLTEATVQVIGGNRILIEVPAVIEADSEKILKTITQTSLMEFVDFGGLQSQAQQYTGQIISTTAQVERGIKIDEALLHPTTGQPFESVMTGATFSAVAAQYNQNLDQWFIAFEVASDFQDHFADYTASRIGQPLAIVLDGEVLSVPTIQAQLRTGGIIAGNFNEDEAKTLALQLRAGSLTLPVSIESVETITSP